MRAFEVTTAFLLEQFYALPLDIYRYDENWTTQLGKDVEQIFCKNTNSFFRAGNCKRWIVYDDWNNLAGRIAAFHHTINDSEPVGGFGFFECTKNDDVARHLLNTAISWLTNQGCKTIQGPINFGDKDRFWGLLTSGFESPSLYLENYNPAYYEKYFLDFGLFEKEIIYTFKSELDQIPHERLAKAALRLADKQIYFRPFCFERLEQDAHDLHVIYKKSFKDINRFKHLSADDIIKLIRASKALIEDDLLWIGYKDHKPIALLGFMKDLNQVMNLRQREKPNAIHLKGFVFAVVPEFHKQGIEAGLCYSLYNSLIKKEKKYILFLTGINSNSKAMISFLQKLNSNLWKIHKTFFINA